MRIKGQTVERKVPIAVKDSGIVTVKMTFEVPAGYEIEWVGAERGDPTWNNGQGYFAIKLSVLKGEQTE